MTKSTLKVFALLTALSAVGLVRGVASAEHDKTLEDLTRYREWTRVTRKPLAVEIPSVGG